MSTNDKSAKGKEINQSLLAPEQIGELLIEYLHSNQPLTAAIRAHLTGDQACVEQRLQPTPSDERPDISDWLDGATAEDLLGVSTRTLQHYRDTGILPYSKVGNKIYYKRSDLSAMIERHYQKGGQR